MSILKNTQSGIYSPLSTKMLEDRGYERLLAKYIINPSEIKFCNLRDHNMKINYYPRTNQFTFTLEPKMFEPDSNTKLYSETLVLKNLADVKLLEEWWFCEDIHKVKYLEKQILKLRIFSIIDVSDSIVKEYSEKINKEIVEKIFKISGVPSSSLNFSSTAKEFTGFIKK